jgi:hypothetical protein
MTATHSTATTPRPRAGVLRAVALGAAAGLSLLALAACGGPPPQEGPPPPMSSTAPPPPSPELLGAPPAPPAPAAEPAPRPDFHMAPVANPEDMAPDERVRVYGHRYDYLDHPAARTEGGRDHRRRHHHGARGGAHAARDAHHGRAAFTHGAGGGAPGAKPASPAPEPKPPAAQPSSPGAHPSAPAASTATSTEGAGAPSAAASSAAASSAAAGGAPNRLNTDALSIPGAPTLDVPGFGKTPSKTVVAIGLLLLALAILALAIRGAPARKPRTAAASRPIDLGASIAATPHEPKADKPAQAEGDGKTP